MKSFSVSLILSMFTLTQAAAFTSNACNYRMWPVYAGGNKEETLKCFSYDSTNNYFIVGGVT